MRFGSWLLVLSSVLMTSLTAKAVRIVAHRPLWGELSAVIWKDRSGTDARAAEARSKDRPDCPQAPQSPQAPQGPSDEAVLVDVLSTSAALRTPVMRVAPAEKPACLLPAIAPAVAR